MEDLLFIQQALFQARLADGTKQPATQTVIRTLDDSQIHKACLEPPVASLLPDRFIRSLNSCAEKIF